MSKPNARASALDNLLLAVFGFSLVVPTIVQSYDLDTRLVWLPTGFYAFWILFKAYLNPKYFLSDSPERAMIERIGGWYYVFSLAITLVGNYILLGILPRTTETYFLGVSGVAFMNMLILVFLPRRLFRKEIIYMNKKQEMDVYKILRETGSASIFLSIIVLILNLEFMGSTKFSIENAILTLSIVFILFIYSFFRDKKSSKLAHELAISLINSGWYKNYSSKREN